MSVANPATDLERFRWKVFALVVHVNSGEYLETATTTCTAINLLAISLYLGRDVFTVSSLVSRTWFKDVLHAGHLGRGKPHCSSVKGPVGDSTDMRLYSSHIEERVRSLAGTAQPPTLQSP